MVCTPELLPKILSASDWACCIPKPKAFPYPLTLTIVVVGVADVPRSFATCVLCISVMGSVPHRRIPHRPIPLPLMRPANQLSLLRFCHSSLDCLGVVSGTLSHRAYPRPLDKIPPRHGTGDKNTQTGCFALHGIFDYCGWSQYQKNRLWKFHYLSRRKHHGQVLHRSLGNGTPK